MIKQNQRIINFLNIISDAALIFCSFYLALYVRFEFLHGHTSLELFSARYLLIVMGYSLLVVLVFAALRMYGSYRFKEPGSEIATILLVNGIAVLAFMAFLYVTRVMEFPRLALFLFWLLSSAAVIGKRTVVRGLLRHYRKLGYNQKHVLLVGNGPLAKRYLKTLCAQCNRADIFGLGTSPHRKRIIGSEFGALPSFRQRRCKDLRTAHENRPVRGAQPWNHGSKGRVPALFGCG